MKAKDVMTTGVVVVSPDMTVQDVAKVLLDHHISGAPVVDGNGEILGIVSEGDLLRRSEIGTDRRRSSWWLWFFGDMARLAEEYTVSHTNHVTDVMTKSPITVDQDAELSTVADILETNHIKRVPVLADGKLAGIISRANLLRAFAGARSAPMEPISRADEAIRKELIKTLEDAPWGNAWSTNVIVRDGVVELWGTVASEEERKASAVAAENISGVKKVDDRRGTRAVTADGL